MSILAESLKRLYISEQLTLENVKHLYSTGKITKEEYAYIVKEES